METCKKHDRVVVVWESLDLYPKCPLCEAFKIIDEALDAMDNLKNKLSEK